MYLPVKEIKQAIMLSVLHHLFYLCHTVSTLKFCSIWFPDAKHSVSSGF